LASSVDYWSNISTLDALNNYLLKEGTTLVHHINIDVIEWNVSESDLQFGMPVEHGTTVSKPAGVAFSSGMAAFNHTQVRCFS